MAAVTTTNSYVLPLGPIKIEIANIASVDDADTYVSTIQNPSFGVFIQNTDDNGNAPSVGVGISGRTITLNSSAMSAETGVLILAGF